MRTSSRLKSKDPGTLVIIFFLAECTAKPVCAFSSSNEAVAGAGARARARAVWN